MSVVILSLAVVCTSVNPSEGGATRLEFATTVRTVPREGANGETREEASPLVVWLGGDELIVEHPRRRTRYGIAKQRIVTEDMEKKEAQSRSLLSEVAFRIFEFQNRERLRDVMKQVAGGEKTFPERVPAEHAFSVRLEKTPVELDRTEVDGIVTYRAGDDRLLAYSVEVEPTEPEVVRRFVRAVRLEFGGHPQILRDLSALPGIPRRLVIERQDVPETKTTTLELKSIERGVTLPTSEGFVERTIVTNERLAALIEKARAATSEENEARVMAEMERLKRAIGEKEVIPAFLVNAELGLHRHFARPPVDLAPLLPLMRESENVKALTGALGARTPEQRKEAEATFSRLRERAADEAHLLGIFRANNLIALGRPDEAETAFLTGLEGNPFLTGAWKDLGDLYFGKFDMATAWLCWEIGRRFEREHPIFRGVNDLESRLQADFPEYFTLDLPKTGDAAVTPP